MNHPASDRLELSNTRPLASGSYRDIFQHPHDENLLVKVVKRSRRKSRQPWYKSWRKNDNHLTLLRELKEYRSLDRKNLRHLPFIQKYFGDAETDIGPGMVVEKLRGRDGHLAPTVAHLVQHHGLTDVLRDRFFELRDLIIAHNIVFADVRASNIVLAHDGNGDRLVVIDGLGDGLWLPVSAMSAKINRMNRRRHFQRAFEQIEAMDRERAAERTTK